MLILKNFFNNYLTYWLTRVVLEKGPLNGCMYVCSCCNQEADVYFETGYQRTRVFRLDMLRAGHLISGPAIIIDRHR